MTSNPHADELRQFIERYEALEADKRAVAEDQKEVLAEAKGRGYDTRIMREVIRLRQQDPDTRAEHDAILEMYKTAVGID